MNQSPSKISSGNLIKSSDVHQNALNYERYQDMENELDQENLVSFIKESCLQQKQDLKQQLDHLIAEKERTSALVKDLSKSVQLKENKIKQIDKKTQNEARHKQLKVENQELQAQIASYNTQLQQLNEPITALEETYEQSKKLILQDNIKKLYAYLEKKNNEALIYIIESLVGLMRGQRRADPVSVELYTKKYEGFMIGLGRTEARSLNPAVCQEHLNQMQNYEHSFESSELLFFQPFQKVLENLSQLAVHYKDVVELENKIEQNEKTIEANQREIEQIETWLQNNTDLPSFIKRDIEFQKTTELKIFKDKEAQLKEQIDKMRQLYDRFEEHYFADL